MYRNFTAAILLFFFGLSSNLIHYASVVFIPSTFSLSTCSKDSVRNFDPHLQEADSQEFEEVELGTDTEADMNTEEDVCLLG
ncbi:unnamed protein product [Gongylonema pulchrum]|uniref:Secreted protein n=1 Tax=Gongylonema pulchrum TaxID=637853 RepID=A0A183DK73_9BILA|nr:unnamed protein product [Gongylonema pulchrum]